MVKTGDIFGHAHGNGAPTVPLDEVEAQLGWQTYEDGPRRIGYLLNIKTHKVYTENRREAACVLLYFAMESGQLFKCIMKYEPYFYVLCRPEHITDVQSAVTKQFHGVVLSAEIIDKTDLGQINHLSGIKNPYLRIAFRNVNDLMKVRGDIKSKMLGHVSREVQLQNYLEAITDIREFDVPYYTRVMIDKGVRCGLWYSVEYRTGNLELSVMKEKLTNPNLKVCAFDIETFKPPLKFPDSARDPIMLISYMIDGEGFLISNRAIISQDIEDFEYTPRPEYEGRFKVFNERDEKGLLLKFFDHMRTAQPTIYVTFNGDYFDWPYIEARSKQAGISMEVQLGIVADGEEYKGRSAIHMDCLYWVKRDAYLPQGSHGLKKVTKAKLGYNPVELDPEEMVPYARERPNDLAAYSVSDAVATYYLYKKMIHDFIFALSTIIPMHPDDVLRKGSGTLCEQLLMAQAHSRNIIFPNKVVEAQERFYSGHLIESDTYVGGHVECLEVGVYRNDIPVRFHLDPGAYKQLIDEADQAINFCVEIEHKKSPLLLSNRDQVRTAIVEKLAWLRDNRDCSVLPLIYHLDVAAMYPNIILSNRLQPTAIVSEAVCAGCVYNRPENMCKRELQWVWRGDLHPLSKGEYEGIKRQLESEAYERPPEVPIKREQPKEGKSKKDKRKEKEEEMEAEDEHREKIHSRVKEYCKKVYNHIKTQKEEKRSETVCMRENSFYVDTVRDFRDRRYEYKNLVKVAKGQCDAALKKGDLIAAKEAEERMSLYESLQLAHKIILNSFYGYVMRKGARWYSMEMAGMVTHVGANIITDARSLVDKIGKPLELDTDGIWCLLPACFPENFTLEVDGRKLPMSYPCTMLNRLIYDKYKNSQYQEINGNEYDTRTEMSVFFEIDGPYRAMIIPASTEENKMLKKRYAVFHLSGKLAELKGFEMKRRGELKLIKVFQEEIFDRFLDGTTLQESYLSAAVVADRWFDLLEFRGAGLDTEEVIEYLCENRTLARSLDDYGTQKSIAITVARRLAEVLGEEAAKEKGLNCRAIIARKPEKASVTERAIPAVIFSDGVIDRDKLLRQWLQEGPGADLSFESVVDWDYYKERLISAVQKVITIPAHIQKVPNPTPRIPFPDWLKKKASELEEKFHQRKVDTFFKPVARPPTVIPDIEEIVTSVEAPKKSFAHIEDGFDSWLAGQQSLWRERRAYNLKFREKPERRSAGDLVGFVKSSEESLLYKCWHVIGLYPDTPGRFKLWMCTEDLNFVKVTLSVQRVIYICSKTECKNEDFVQVKMQLPRPVTAQYIYETRMDEADFQRKVNDIYTAAANPNIEAVYESKLPLIVHALLQTGAVLRPKISVLRPVFDTAGALSKHEFTPDEFDVATDKMYLHFQSKLPYITVYHSASKTRSVSVVFISTAKKAVIFVSAPGIRDKVNFQAMMKSKLGYVCSANYYGDTAHVFPALKKLIAEEKRGGAIIFASPGLDPAAMHVLSSCDLPLVVPEGECFALPSIDWQRTTVQWAVNSFCKQQEKTQEMLSYCRYGNVPIGNLPSDPAVFLCDLLLARSLRAGKSLLWWSDNHKPDFGGREEDWVERDLKFEEFARPGIYPNVTVELDLGVVPANALLCYKALTEEETNDENPFDDRSICQRALISLRKMTSTWFDDIVKRRNKVADDLIIHFYRWVSSPRSAMYDPALHFAVHQSIQQMLVQLVSECSRLGAQVVYSHSDKLIINTRRATKSDAEEYCTFLQKTLSANLKFASLQLTPTHFWRILLFKDVYNYAGMLMMDDEIRLTSQLHVLECLPYELGRYATAIVGELLTKCALLESEDHTIPFLKRYIQEDLTRKLLDKVPALLVGGSNGQWEYPEKLGQRLGGNAALDFIKVLIHLLQLDTELEGEATLLRRALLQCMHIGEYSAEVEYTEPCASLILPEVICRKCLSLRDLDLCRDPQLSQKLFKCNCEADLDRTEIQAKLLLLLQEQCQRYWKQDLKCSKCKYTMGTQMRPACSCSGKFVKKIEAKKLRDLGRIVREVAALFEMEWIGQVLRSISPIDF